MYTGLKAGVNEQKAGALPRTRPCDHPTL